MRSGYLKNTLRFCCVIDDAAADPSLTEQVETALKAGATLIRYHGSGFSPERWNELQTLCRRCQSNGVPFLIRDNLLLAKAIGADGIHLEASDDRMETVRNVLGPEAIIGTADPRRTDTKETFDYLEVTPFDSNVARKAAPLFIIAGGILESEGARQAIDRSACGITVDRAVFQSETPADVLAAISDAGRIKARPGLQTPWRDEFGLIEKILAQAPDTGSGIIVPPGDDACLLTGLSRPVISTDTQKEGVHFRLDWQSPEEIGEKAVSITLSDLAASYARPVSLFANLGVPPRLPDAFMEALYRGIHAGLQRYGCGMGGGNISGGKELSLDLFAVGQGKEVFPERSNARAGFDLYVTGPLGMARAGLEALRKNDSGFPELIERFKHPRARFDAAEVLASNGVTCVMDVSDGLSGDAAHLAEASNLTIELDVAGLSHPDALASFCRKHSQSPDAFALSGGEDYELLFACLPETFTGIRTELPDAVRVGRVLPFRGRRIIAPETKLTSYRHGA
jgi:thiamine-monophosphate kinase